MLRAGAGRSTALEPERAAAEAVEGALAALGQASASTALVLAAGPLLRDPVLLADELDARLRTSCWAGASGAGVLASGLPEEGDGLVVLVLDAPGAQLCSATALRRREATAGGDLRRELGREPAETDLIVLFADAPTLDLRRLLDGLDALAPASVVGAGASAAVGDPILFAGGEVLTQGAVALVLPGTRPPRIAIARSGRPISHAFVVTACEGHWLLELDGRPALEVYREVCRGPLSEDLSRALRFVLAAVPGPACDDPCGPDAFVRQLVGIDPRRGAISLPGGLSRGQRLAFVLRDAEGARAELERALAGAGEPAPRGALVLGCCARGESLFGVRGLETAYLERALPGIPFVGLLAASEIAPLRRAPRLLTHASVIALLD